MRKQPREIVYGGAVIGEEEIAAVVKVLRRGIQPGENVAAFERRVAALLGKRHGVMVNSGSSALLVAMRLLGAPPGSEVLTSVLTFSTDVASIVHAGCVPAFVDCELDTYQIDVDAVERMIGPQTRALLVPDLVGGMPDWDRLEKIAKSHDLVLIETPATRSAAATAGARRASGRRSASRASRRTTSSRRWGPAGSSPSTRTSSGTAPSRYAAGGIMRHGTMLPCHPTMTDDDCEYLYEVIEGFVAKMR